MKSYSLIGLLFSVIVLTEAVAMGPSDNRLSRKELRKQEQAAFERKVADAINAQNYTIYIDRVIPAQGRSFSVSNYYNLRIEGDKVFSALPYFGRAYSIPYGGGDGLHFDSVMTGYKKTVGKKGNIQVQFETRNMSETYKYNIDIYSNGGCVIYVMPNNKQNITFNGYIRFLDDKK